MSTDERGDFRNSEQTPIRESQTKLPPPTDESLLEGQAIPLPPEAESRLRDIGVDPNDPRFRFAVLIGTAFAGPIPPPSMLLEYRAVHPDLPEKIIQWSEIQRDHRVAMEKKAADGAESRMNRGQIFAFCIACLGFCLSAVAGIAGSPIVGSVFAIVSIGGPTAAFVLARSFDSEHGRAASTVRPRSN
jgi:uncharacterized membrane protein